MKTSSFYFTHRRISPLLLDALWEMNNKDTKTKKILDVGCGDGVMVYDLQKLGVFNKTNKITGIDILPDNIYIAKKRLKNINFLVADALVLPFKDRSFDFIYSWMVLEHLLEPNRMITEIVRVMKSEGRCYLSTVMRSKRAIYFYRRGNEFVLDPTHVHEFRSVEDFSKLIKKAGLEVIRVRKSQRYYSVIELVLKVLIKLNIIRPKVGMRDFFGSHRIINILRGLLIIPIPGFYQLEALCEMDRKSK